jgi:hypothetical protein
MAYLRGILSGLAAIFVALLGPGLIVALSQISREKATGLAVFGGDALLESVSSPLFWVIAGVFFALFFTASRLKSEQLRILLFWIPTTGISVFGIGFFVLDTYFWIHFHPRG